VRGALVVGVTCRSKQKRKWKTEDKASTVTTITTIIKTTIIKRMKTVGTDNTGKKMPIIFCLYQHNSDKQSR